MVNPFPIAFLSNLWCCNIHVSNRGQKKTPLLTIGEGGFCTPVKIISWYNQGRREGVT